MDWVIEARDLVKTYKMGEFDVRALRGVALSKNRTLKKESNYQDVTRYSTARCKHCRRRCHWHLSDTICAHCTCAARVPAVHRLLNLQHAICPVVMVDATT